MDISVDIISDCCEDGRKKLIVEQNKETELLEVYIICDCGEKDYLCSNGDTIG